MKILQFIKEKNCPSRELLLDSVRLGDAILLELDPTYPGGYIAFNVERMRNHSKNGEWFVDFRDSFGGKSTFAYLSTYKKKAFVVDERFKFPENGHGINYALSKDEITFLCHLTEFGCAELNDRILQCFIDSADFYMKQEAIKQKIKNLVSMRMFKKKAKDLIPVVHGLLNLLN